MADFDTRKPQKPKEPSRHRIAIIADKLRSSLMANRLRSLLIGGGILVAIVAVGVGLLLYRSGDTDASRQGHLGEAPNGKITFVRSVPNDYGTPVGNVFLMSADGTGERNLTRSTTAGETQPVWSPDGEKIAFIRNDENGYSINVMNADGTGRTRLTDDAMVFSQIAWSPDGERIAFSRSDGAGTGDMYVIDADGTDQTRLTSTAGDEISVGAPVWSPDGEKIAFERYVAKVTRSASAAAADSTAEPAASPVPEMSGIYVVDADGTGQATPINSMEATSLAWSPDGEKIAFVNSGEIYTMNANGTGRTRLTDVAGTRLANVEGATWSPSAEMIAFWASSSSGSTTDLCAINCDGSGLKCLAKNVLPTNTVGSPQEVAWGTNTDSQEQGKTPSSVESSLTKDYCRSVENSGGEIAFALTGDIWTMKVDGSNATRLTHDLQRVDEDTPAWSPDGKKIAFAKKGMRTEVLAIMDSDGCNEVELPVPEGTTVYEPSWSPEGTEIAFRAAGDIYKIDVNSLEKTRLTSSPDTEDAPTWSPDGEQIAFVREDSDTYSRAIYVMQSDGSNLTLARDFSQGIGEIEDHHTGTMRLDWRSPP